MHFHPRQYASSKLFFAAKALSPFPAANALHIILRHLLLSFNHFILCSLAHPADGLATYLASRLYLPQVIRIGGPPRSGRVPRVRVNELPALKQRRHVRLYARVHFWEKALERGLVGGTLCHLDEKDSKGFQSYARLVAKLIR